MDSFDNKILKNEKVKDLNLEIGIDPLNDVVTMKIPNSLGITGLVYKTDEIHVCQNV